VAPPTPMFSAKNAEPLSSLNKNVPFLSSIKISPRGMGRVWRWGMAGRLFELARGKGRPHQTWAGAGVGSAGFKRGRLHEGRPKCPIQRSRKSQKPQVPDPGGKDAIGTRDTRLGRISLCCFQEFPLC
jgi:hypothetical protein